MRICVWNLEFEPPLASGVVVGRRPDVHLACCRFRCVHQFSSRINYIVLQLENANKSKELVLLKDLLI